MANLLSVTVKGEKEMLNKLSRFANEFPKKAAAAVFKRSEKIMTRSKRDFAPVDVGTLRDTGTVEKPEITPGKGITVTLAYGGPAVDYAAEQHEFHKTKSKYLENPLNEAASTLAEDLAKDLKL